jgi:hypothetical protein
MLSEVKGIMSTEIFNLENYKPDDDENFSFLLTVTVGPKGEIGGDNFDIDVCTPKWLLNNQYDDVILGKGKLIVFRCEMKRILAKVRALFDGCSGKDWNEIAMKLSRIGQWEFEDYRG